MRDPQDIKREQAGPGKGRFAAGLRALNIGTDLFPDAVDVAAETPAAELDRLEHQFDLAGGRGVEMADRIDALRARDGVVRARDEVNAAYTSLDTSQSIADLRHGAESGYEPNGFPVDEHRDATRALRRYSNAMERFTDGRTDVDQVLEEPYSLDDAVAACDEDGVLTGVVGANLDSIMQVGSMADDLVGLLVEDGEYREDGPGAESMEVVGVGADNMLHIRISTNLRTFYDGENGAGEFDKLRASTRP